MVDNTQAQRMTQAKEVAAAVDPGRVLARLEALAEIGAQPSGGISCLAFSDEEAAANALFTSWMEGAGLTVARDEIGNLFGSTDGNQPGIAVVAAGSHLDTVPDGGKYDGRLGLIAALEALEAIRAVGCSLPDPLELIIWRSEEPSRFPAGRIGSQVFSGSLTIDELLPQGAAFGLSERLQQEAASAHPLRATGRSIASYLELHIEQGKRLEDTGKQIGVVTGIAGSTRVRIEIVGVADHSGATPMGLRHDALCAAAELVLATEQAGMSRAAQEMVATAVRLHALPDAVNVVPGQVELWLDVRGTDQLVIAETLAEIVATGETIALQRGVTIKFSETAGGTPVRFPTELVALVDQVAQELGYTTLIMPSGAGHDAQTVAALAPSAMIFVPSVAGISHSPAEYSTPEAIERGVRTFAAAWVYQAFQAVDRRR